LKRLVASIGIDYLALILFFLIFLVLFLSYGSRITVTDGSIVWPTVVLIVIVISRAIAQRHRFTGGNREARREVIRESLTIVRDWLPVILLIFVYENLRLLTGLIRPDNIDAHLWAADVALFGVEPTIWAERFVNPWLTDYFAFTYALYFFFPLILATTLYVRKKREDFRELMLGVVLLMYVGFLLYITFPAGPPRFTIAHLYDPPRLHGIFGFFETAQGAYDTLNPVLVHSSFPSLHCALSLIALLYAWRFRAAVGSSVMFWTYLPLTASLWVATIYLRHHWIVDCFAGFALAIVVFLATPWLRRRYNEFRDRVLAKK
jgi:membrane-associated phospholipid phosphatase